MNRAAILIVEDNPTTRKMLRLTLATEGFAVIEAEDGRAALATAETSLPALVLQDLILPDMSGLELLRRLRDLPGGTELPIVALSGFLGSLEEAPTDERGFTALLVKPIEPNRLVAAVRAFLPAAPPADASIGRGRRLLVVDDDPVQLKLTRIYFSQLGFEVLTAGNAAEALASAGGSRPDAILSDVLMPGTDGFQLCLQIRTDPGALAAVPVVLLSGQYGSSADQELARRVGASALILRTPDFSDAVPVLLAALDRGVPEPVEGPSDEFELSHARRVIHQLEQQNAAMAGVAQRCGIQAAQLSLLSGVAEALSRNGDIDVALRDVLAATLDAAGISKGALFLKDSAGVLQLRQDVGFSPQERSTLQEFFGHRALLEEIVDHGGSVSVPSSGVSESVSRHILVAANVASAQVVPLIHDQRGIGALIIAATHTDVTSDHSVAFARAMGNQVVQSLQLAESVARLTTSEQRYRTLLDGASDYIAVLTPDGIVRELNRRWTDITGLPREQLLGRHIREFAPTGKTDLNVQKHNDAEGGIAATTQPVEIATPGGSHVLIEFSRTNVDIGGERLVFTIGRDVTERRLLEDQLRQSQKLEAVGQLAGGVAHDFNNILTAILGFTAMIMERVSVNDPVQRDLLQIQKAGQRAAALTGQLLAFSRRQILQPKVLDINEVVRGLEPMLRRLIPEHIHLTGRLARDAGLIEIDPTQLELILVNLVVNAADAMPRGGKLSIETSNELLDECHQGGQLPVTPGAHVMFAVSDTGVGMAPATVERIFEPFFTTKGPGKGTGLGLATIYGIVKQSGGDIWVYSEPGRGTTFKIYLPQVTSIKLASADGATAKPESSKGTETILLVEDDDAVRRLARMTLERSGYRVLDAENPKRAMSVAREHNDVIHILVSDVIMPESEGSPLFEQLAALHRHIRVLYMSGYADEAVVRHGILADGAAFLHKPFSPDALARKVRDVLDARGPQASP